MEEGGYVVLTQEEEEESSFDAAEEQREYNERRDREPYDGSIADSLKRVLPRLRGLSKRDLRSYRSEAVLMDALGIDGLLEPGLYNANGVGAVYDMLENMMIFFSMSDENRHTLAACSEFCVRLKVRIAPSPEVHGFGLFARKWLKNGEDICAYGGLRLPANPDPPLPQSHRFVVSVSKTAAYVRARRAFETQDDTVLFTIDGEYGFLLKEAGRWANSDTEDPNCHLEYHPNKGAWLVATRDIEPGEEIVWDYGERYWGSKTNKKQRLVEHQLAAFYI
jgi:hypothetical protein